MTRLAIAFSVALGMAVFAVHGLASTPSDEGARAAAAEIPDAAQNGAAATPVANTTETQRGYVGTETCVTCHEGFDASINRTKHGFANDPRTPAAARGCESCHGPGEAHVQDPAAVKPNAFTKMAARDVNATCVTCHNRGEHTMWEGSAHDSRNLACTTCHSVHTPKSEKGQLKTVSQVATCATCHRDKANKLDRSGHMPVREGKMECTSCHNVHGAKNTRLLRAGFTVTEACTSCHADKRGPFLWEHAPVRESCVTCHDPHGSSNERMLVAKAPFLCQRCHTHTRHPATIYDKTVLSTSNRIFGRSCVSCHSQIHGSNHPSGNFLVR